MNIKPTNKTLIELLEMVLTMNNFTFNGDHYIQVGGTAMGTKVAPGFANAFMGDFEEQYVYPYPMQPLKYLRFLDDIFLVWQYDLADLNEFLNHMNSQVPSIKFTMEYSKESVHFLDTNVSINNASLQLETDLYCKPTDSHNYLLYNSAHPKKCKQSIPYSQFLRIKRICSKTEDFDRHIVTMSGHFLRRGYPINLLEEAAIKARRLDRDALLSPKDICTEKTDNVILVTTFEPSQDILRNITFQNWEYMGKSPTTLHIHQKKIMVGYRRPKNLRDLLVKADCTLPKNYQIPFTTQDRENFLRGSNPPPLAPSRRTKQSSMTDFIQTITGPTTVPLHRSTSASYVRTQPTSTPVRSRSLTRVAKPNLLRNKCKAKQLCNFCPLLDKSGTLECHVTKKLFPIKQNITCRSSNLVYCISCKTCGKQYVGQTKRTILERFQGHFNKINTCQTGRREDPILFRQTEKDATGTHFSAPDHNGTKDLSISVLAFITSTPQSLHALDHRLKVEKEWIHRLRCPAPTGLNILD